MWKDHSLELFFSAAPSFPMAVRMKKEMEDEGKDE